MFLKSPSTSVSWSSPSSPAPKSGQSQGQDDKKFIVPRPPPPQPAPNINNDKSSNQAAAGSNVSDSKKQEEKKKKKKKKNPPTLFEFDGKDPTLRFHDVPRGDRKSKDKGPKKNKKQPKPVAPPAQKPAPVIPAVPIVPVVPDIKQQHDWKELEEASKDLSEDEPDMELHLDDADDYADVGTNKESLPVPGNHRSKENPPIWEERKNKVKQAFLHAWNAYRRDAWGKDEYHPISKYGSNMIRKGQGFTIVDSLDTILLMGLEDEFQEAKTWVKNELDFDQDGEVNLFETTIRVLGGLLSAYDQSDHDPVFLHKAVDLADRLMGAFDTPSGIPYASVHLKEGRGVPGHDRGVSSTSEVTTLQLEFKYLSYLTKDDKYWKAAENVMFKIKEQDSLDGLVPIFINPYTGHFQGGEIRLGSRGDSYYGKQQYLIKQYLQTGMKEPIYKEMYDRAIGGVKKHLLGRTIPNNLLFVGEISKYEPTNLSPKMDHLVCFLGGTMALASTGGVSLDDQTFSRSRFSRAQEEDFKIGEELTKSCYEMYHQTETGLASEIVYWVQKQEQIRGKSALQHTPGSDFIINDRDGHNWLRPETVESLFYLWRLTGDEKYRQWGWEIFEAIEKYSKVASGGYSSIHDIRRANKINFSDKMETFFLAETLKYFYLLFGSDDVLPLDKYVFNTEAHPLPIFTPPEEFLARTGGAGAPHVGDSKKLSTEEERWYKDLLDKEDGGLDATAKSGDDEDEEAMRDGDIGVEDMEDEVAGTDDSLLSETMNETGGENSEGELELVADPEADEDADVERDEVDQGLEDLTVDDEDEEAEEVPEVEVDYENSEGEQEEGEEGEVGEEGEEGDEGDEEEGGEGEEEDEMDGDSEQEQEGGEEEGEDDEGVEYGGEGDGQEEEENQDSDRDLL
ncbi:mannosyl-oligosaccharide alpha-1,2-mannosidase [Gamsiella multidivaricata]|nr:mannosyl-oligosaccharide alpha-1,2-mannosidase [Gamsiella multidivaricata]